jgi:hypothetical protein
MGHLYYALAPIAALADVQDLCLTQVNRFDDAFHTRSLRLVRTVCPPVRRRNSSSDDSLLS